MTNPGEYVMPFGKHEGKKLDDVPLSYIDWLSGIALAENTRKAVDAYIDQDWFEAELEAEKARA